jgi:hypothetical protein
LSNIQSTRQKPPPIAPPTRGDIKASAICIFWSFRIWSDYSLWRQSVTIKATQANCTTALRFSWFRCQLRLPFEITPFFTKFAVLYYVNLVYC